MTPSQLKSKAKKREPKKAKPSKPPVAVKLTTKDDELFQAQKKVLDQFIRDTYWNLYLDIFLLFSLTIVFSIVLIYLEDFVGQIFLIFGIICCIIIMFNYYNDVKDEIDKVIKDLQVLFKK